MKKNELIFTGIILGLISFFGIISLLKAQVLARDIQRKNDLKHIATSLDNYRKQVSAYPVSRNGKMVSCLVDEIFRECEWGRDSLESTQEAFIKPLPEDPLAPGGKYSYVYSSNIRNYQIFASLEQSKDDEINQTVINRNIKCGDHICNFGVSSSGTPLDEELSINYD